MMLRGFTIARHAVPHGADKLSPLQALMLNDKAPVRVFSAPTGAGKSYAFIKAVERGQRVLFIVPTRRLAQNLVADAERLFAALDPPRTGAVALWSSDGTIRQQRRDPGSNTWHARLAELRDTGVGFIVATPEAVALMLLRHAWGGPGTDRFGATALVQGFDHVVFDEFHSIDPRGFGLCALVARISVESGGLHTTFLSATPIDIIPVLLALDIPAEQIVVGSETVEVSPLPGAVPGMRVLHGDVRVEFDTEPDMVALLDARMAEMRACLDRGLQVVVILDSLAALHANRTRLAAVFDRLGVAPHERLAINSIDDGTEGAPDGLFVADRGADPSAFKVLLATSSIEMGVTFRAGMLVMDPGYDALGFVQRIGRVARSDVPGLVIVRCDPARNGKLFWLRKFTEALKHEHEERLTVTRFNEQVLSAVQKRFDADAAAIADNRPPTEFRTMPHRAIWAACLFWHAMDESRPRNLAGERQALNGVQPKKVRRIASLLRTVGGPKWSKEKTVYAGWADSFLAQAGTLRDIAASMTVQEPDRTLKTVPLDLLDRCPALLGFPLLASDNGGWTLVLDRPLHVVLANADTRYVDRMRTVMLPNGQIHTVPALQAAEYAIAAMQRLLNGPGTTAAERKRLRAAVGLVQLSGLVPSEPIGPTGGARVV